MLRLIRGTQDAASRLWGSEDRGIVRRLKSLHDRVRRSKAGLPGSRSGKSGSWHSLSSLDMCGRQKK